MNIPNKRNSLLFPVHFSFIPVIFFFVSVPLVVVQEYKDGQ